MGVGNWDCVEKQAAGNKEVKDLRDVSGQGTGLPFWNIVNIS